MNNIDKLQDFIKRAQRNYKYKPNTASALSVAIKLFSNVMTEEELAEDKFPQDRLDEIAERIHTKFGDRYSVDSLQTYKSRINRVVNDFAKYGADAKSMASWNPLNKQRQRATKTKSENKPAGVHSSSSKSSPETSDQHEEIAKQQNLPGVQDITLPLADNRNIVIYYPVDLTETEAEKVGVVLKGIAALSKDS